MISLFYFLVLIFSVVIHEVSHGVSARAQGDATAEYAGRLTLNPLKHLDPLGSIIVPGFLYLTRSPVIFGWAKPVPYNPFNLRNQRWGPALVALAGPASNVALAILFSILFRFFAAGGMASALPFLAAIIFLNLILAVFNLVPIPPLDGSKLLAALIPDRWREIEKMLEVYGIFLLVLFLFFGFQYLAPVFVFLFQVLAGPQSLAALATFQGLL